MGPAIFILWKAALLRKRILIYTPPPVESTCLAGKRDWTLHLVSLEPDSIYKALVLTVLPWHGSVQYMSNGHNTLWHCNSGCWQVH